MHVQFGAPAFPRRRNPRGLGPAALGALLSVGLASFGVSALAPRAAEAQSGATFTSTANPGGGEIIAGTLGTSSLPAATAALLRRVHASLGGRPTIVQVARNARDHSLALLFTATRGGTPYTGIALVTAAPGAQAGGAALYDTRARFRTTVGPMMRRLNAMTSPSAATSHAATKLAPAEPLVTHEFRDGTGSIGVPADWKLEVYGGGSAMASGPTGEIVAYNMAWSAMDMSNPRAQFFMRSQPPQMRRDFLSRVALLPYTSDPVQAWLTVPNQLAKQRGGFQPRYDVKRATRNGNMADIVAIVEGKKQAHILAHALVLPPNPNGQWTLTNTFVYVPDSEIARQGATASAVLNSVRINFGAVAAQGAAIRQMFQKNFETMIANDRAQDAAREQRGNEAMAADRAAQEGMHKQAVAMENYSLDRAVVVDSRTGAHSTIGSGFADTLVQNNPNYQKVPTQQLLRGVDY
ncbi:MAG TPA: hypothetical protein VFB22_07735 [Candidatus Baltobacteraceae bacterium]|nr:hypothetical protein [Candidatus Baltobacteraceae bacterium]